jgi:hypothetical protein
MDPAFWATIGSVGSVIVGVAAVFVAYVGLKRQLEQNFAIVGAQSAIEWREQVFDLHDRGLSPDEIRYIMYLERGGKEYEWQNGLIDEVVGMFHAERWRIFQIRQISLRFGRRRVLPT